MKFNYGKYELTIHIEDEPAGFKEWLQSADFTDVEDFRKDETPIYVRVYHELSEEVFVIVFSSNPIGYAGFEPGFLVIPESQTLFIGAGTRAKTYNLKFKRKQFEKEFSCGFWGWARHKNLVIMQEELEFGVYTLNGLEKWSTFVEPPWEYEIEGDWVKLDVMGNVSYRHLETGELR